MFVLVDEDGAQVAVSKGRLVVKNGSAIEAEYLKHDVEGVIAFGHVEVTRAALDLLLKKNAPVHLLSSRGRYLGCLMPQEQGLPLARVNQYRAFAYEAGKVPLARAATRAQLANLHAVVRRWGLRRDDEEVAVAATKIAELRSMVPDATTLDELRGLEGRAWKLAYRALGVVLEPYAEFSTRQRRPAPDPPNALLSLFGSLTAGHAASMLRAVGLDPAVGFNHGNSRGGPALALDLTDIYRPMLCLAPTAALLTKRVVGDRDFWPHKGQALLTREGIRRVLRLYGAVCKREVTGRDGARTTYLEHMARDAAALAHALRTPGTEWQPLEVR